MPRNRSGQSLASDGKNSPLPGSEGTNFGTMRSKGGKGGGPSGVEAQEVDGEPLDTDLSYGTWDTPSSVATANFEPLSPLQPLSRLGRGAWGPNAGVGAGSAVAGGGGSEYLLPAFTDLGGQRFVGDVEGQDMGALKLLLETNTTIATTLFQLRSWAIDWLRDIYSGTLDVTPDSDAVSSDGWVGRDALWREMLEGAAAEVLGWADEDVRLEAECAESAFPALQVCVCVSNRRRCTQKSLRA